MEPDATSQRLEDAKDCPGRSTEETLQDDEFHPSIRRSASVPQAGLAAETMDLAGTCPVRSRRVSDVDREVDTLLQENQALRHQLEHEMQRARTAEAAALAAASSQSPRVETTGDDGSDASNDVLRLQAEVGKLRAELEDSRSHIFSLQPYRREITPEEVASDWEVLFASVSDCVEGLVGPTLDSESRMQQALIRSRKHPTTFSAILKRFYTQPDLSQATAYPDTDLDVFIAIVMRYLDEHIFQTTLYGALRAHVSAVSAIEHSMGVHVEPRRDQFAIRSWRAEALGALMADPKFSGERTRAELAMSVELAGVFKIFAPTENDLAGAAELLRRECIQPAVRLHEKLLTSTHHFYTTLDAYYAHSSGSKGGDRGLVTAAELFSSLDRLDCKNILQNRKTVTRAKILAGGGGGGGGSSNSGSGGSGADAAELQRTLKTVLALTPAVHMRQVGQRDMVKEPTLVCKQQMLVAWGSPEKREEFIHTGEPTLLAQLHPPSSTHGGGGGGVLDIFGTGGLPWPFAQPAKKRAVESRATSREA